ncbi:MAG TPA: zinc ribbon domain-containing protein [Blastocatellia bacterium]|nr:zinc ribbon domain-containing protein [Blastocatellia bacterium]
MPIYEYVCEKCGDHIEAIQKVGDPLLKRCKKCRGKLEKVVSRTSFQLKGSGWYLTDYSSKSSSKSTEKAEKTDKGSEKEKAPKVPEKSGGAATD